MILVVAGLLVDADGRMLIQERPEDQSFAGCWEYPGGKVNEGELLAEALRREWEEELGLDVDVGRFLCDVVVTRADPPNLHLFLFALRQSDPSQEPRAREGQKILRATMPEIDALPCVPSMRGFRRSALLHTARVWQHGIAAFD